MITLKTKRLILRPWKPEDLAPFAKLNADPEVMECFPFPLSREESDALAKRCQTMIEKQGWGFWAVSVPEVADFIGMIGIAVVPFMDHKPVEVGWRLLKEHWGKGYAVEGATAAMNYGFETLQLPEIIAFTTVKNARSRRVMEKLKMHYDPKDDFEHPRVPEGNPVRPHVLYRITRDEWNYSE